MGDRYNPLYELGAGAFGKAWVVKDNKTGEKCVSKVIQIKGLSSSALDRCVTEVAVLSSCSHINIVQYIEAFVGDGALHIMMEYASGGDLYQKIVKQNGVYFSSDVILEWFLQVIIALEYIHGKNILHRDLKPQNIFLTESGTVKLGDFGIARVLNNCDDLASTRIGTPFYISPEICQRKPYNSSSDMWAAGCLLYQMCTLQVPFQAGNFDDLSKKIVLAQYENIPRHFSPLISYIISKLLVTTPNSRPSASQLLNLDAVRGMVLYLKHKYHAKGQRSRARSSSLVTARSRQHEGEASRSSSVGRVHVNASENNEKNLFSNFNGKGRTAQNSGGKGPSNSKVKGQRQNVDDSGKGKVENKNLNKEAYKQQSEKNFDKNIDKSKKKIEHECESDVRVCNISKGVVKCVSVVDKAEAKTTKGLQEGAVIKETAHVNGDVDDSGKQLNDGSVQHNHMTRINSRTFTIKESVARRLSQASPGLSQTVRKQRFSLSISEQAALDTPKNVQEDEGEHVDDVFQSPDILRRCRSNSLTYVVREKGDSDANNNRVSKEHQNCTDTENLNSTMIQALSVSKTNKELAENILLKEMRVRIGSERCDQVINLVQKLIVEDGQSYQHLHENLMDSEHAAIPLICMYLAL